MPEKIFESLMIIIDASRSMFRTDYNPNRLEASKAAILKFIQARSKHDKSSSFGLISIKETGEILLDISENPNYDQISQTLKEITPDGTSALGDSIGKAIKVLIEDIRRSGARIPRIAIFSDGKPSISKIDPLKMAALAQQLGIRIDTFRIGEVEHLNIMKRISEITNGKYNYATDTPSLLKIAESFGENKVETPLIAYQRGKGISKVLKKIAVPMLSEEEMNKGDDTQQDQIARLRGTKAYQKCAICFSDKDPMTKGAFNISGRYCPNCGQPLHMACAGMWAKNNDMESDGTVFRCPRCLYLISIPASVQTAQKMYQEVKQELRLQKAEATGEQSFPVREVIASQLGEQALYNACPICDAIFEENEPVVKCGNPLCNAIYHKKCFASLSDKHCKTCATRMN